MGVLSDAVVALSRIYLCGKRVLRSEVGCDLCAVITAYANENVFPNAAATVVSRNWCKCIFNPALILIGYSIVLQSRRD